jgi:hypothetical protein
MPESIMDMVLSGGVNVYHQDVVQIVEQHPAFR